MLWTSLSFGRGSLVAGLDCKCTREPQDIGHTTDHSHDACEMLAVTNAHFEYQYRSIGIALFKFDVIDVGFGTGDG
jgi:hypothetical protein